MVDGSFTLNLGYEDPMTERDQSHRKRPVFRGVWFALWQRDLHLESNQGLPRVLL